MLLEIELHQAFARVCSYVSSIYLPRGYSLHPVVSGVYFKNHFSYWMHAFMNTVRCESRVPSDMFCEERPTPVSAHVCAHVPA